MFAYRRDWPRAEADFREAIDIYREVQGDGSFAVGKLVLNLGLCRGQQDDLAGAEPYLRDALNR